MNNEFSDFIFRKRMLNYYSARSFWNANKEKLSITYERYSRIEKGEQTTLKTALELINALSLDEATALHAWVRSQLTDPKHRNYFIDPANSPEFRPNKFIVNTNQRRLIEEFPITYRIMVYIALHSEQLDITEEMLAHEFNIPLKKMTEMLNKLKSTGFLSLRGKNLKFSGWCVIPDSAEFRTIRRENFRSFVNKHIRSPYQENLCMERINIRRIKESHIDELRSKIHSLYRWFVNNDLPADEEGIPYVFFSGGSPIQNWNENLEH